MKTISNFKKLKVYYNQFLIFEYDQDIPIFPNSKFWPKKEIPTCHSFLFFLRELPKSRAIWQWSAQDNLEHMVKDLCVAFYI